MKLHHSLASVSLVVGSLFTLFTASAQAFSFTTNFTGSDPKGDIFLNSVTLADGTTISNFALVSKANIISNDLWTGGNTGAASADLGDRATVGLSQEAVDNAGVVAALGNLNLNSIIDTEDRGSFVIDISFSKVVDQLFFWERGMNSRMDIQALDIKGNLIGNLLNLDSRTWQYAGFGIDTREISGTQRVGSRGVSLTDLGVDSPIAGLRVISRSSYNGPDWKVVGSTAAVPEPTAIAGLGLIAGVFAASRRKTKQQA